MIVPFPACQRPTVEVFEQCRGAWMVSIGFGASDPNPRSKQFPNYEKAIGYAQAVTDIAGLDLIDWTRPAPRPRKGAVS